MDNQPHAEKNAISSTGKNAGPETWENAVRWSGIDPIATRLDSLPQKYSRERLYAVLEVLRRPAEILDGLDREMRRLFAGDRDAAQAIRGVLEPIARHAPLPSWGTPTGEARVRRVSSLLRDNPGGFPCVPGDGVINPITMLFIAEAAQYAAGSDPRRRMAFVSALNFLWLQTERLDLLGHYASENTPTGTDRLVTQLRIEGDRLEWGRDALGEFAPGKHRAIRLPGEGVVLRPGDWIPDGDPNTGPGFPGLGPCGLLGETIRGRVLGKIPVGIGVFRPAPNSERDTDKITAIAPNQACAEELITIRGSGFGSAKPANLDVVLDTTGQLSLGGMVLDVVSWSDTEIMVRVPEGARSGCIGFRDSGLESDLRQIFQDQKEFFGQLNASREMQGLPPLDVPPLPEAPPSTPIPCTGLNRFLGTIPEVRYFESNASVSVIGEPPVLAPGVALELRWQIENANEIRIRRASDVGPILSAPSPLGQLVNSTGTMNLGPFTENRLVVAVYILTAQNRCGAVTAEVRVKLRPTPNLRVRGIEVTQTIQTFNLAGLVPRNTVQLRARHRTLARVYLESGLKTGSFDFGGGIDRLPDTASRLQITTPSGTRIVQPLNVAYAVPPGAQVNQENRNSQTPGLTDPAAHSLNFLLPWDVLAGDVHLAVSVNAADGGPGTHAQGETTVQFRQGRNIRVIFVPISDTVLTLPAPSQQEFVTTWRDAIARLPLSEDHWMTFYVASTFDCDHDLTNRDGWGDLIDDLVDYADDLSLDDHNDLMIGLVQDDARYEGIAGKAPGDDSHLNVVLARKNLPGTVAHETCHAFGIDHSGCNNPDDVDPTLPIAQEDTGVDLVTNRVIPQGSFDLMGYCTPSWPGATRQDRWPSIILWERLMHLLT